MCVHPGYFKWDKTFWHFQFAKTAVLFKEIQRFCTQNFSRYNSEILLCLIKIPTPSQRLGSYFIHKSKCAKIHWNLCSPFIKNQDNLTWWNFKRILMYLIFQKTKNCRSWVLNHFNLIKNMPWITSRQWPLLWPWCPFKSLP